MTTYHSPASEGDIVKASDALAVYFGKCSLPVELINVWREHNGFSGENFDFYSTDTIAERNQAFEVAEFCPGFLAVANDSGSRVALLQQTKANAQAISANVCLNSIGCMRLDAMEQTNLDLERWIDARCPFEMGIKPEVSATERVVLRLDCIPDSGIKGLMEIKKLLGMEIPVHELRSIPNRIPFDLCTTTYIKALRFAAQINAGGKNCVTIWLEKDRAQRCCLVNPFA